LTEIGTATVGPDVKERGVLEIVSTIEVTTQPQVVWPVIRSAEPALKVPDPETTAHVGFPLPSRELETEIVYV